jgi:hypothetical protein
MVLLLWVVPRRLVVMSDGNRLMRLSPRSSSPQPLSVIGCLLSLILGRCLLRRDLLCHASDNLLRGWLLTLHEQLPLVVLFLLLELVLSALCGCVKLP